VDEGYIVWNALGLSLGDDDEITVGPEKGITDGFDDGVDEGYTERDALGLSLRYEVEITVGP
jgi:hypothetical protein